MIFSNYNQVLPVPEPNHKTLVMLHLLQAHIVLQEHVDKKSNVGGITFFSDILL